MTDSIRQHHSNIVSEKENHADNFSCSRQSKELLHLCLDLRFRFTKCCSRAVSNTISRQIEYCRLNQSKLRPVLNIHGGVWNIYEGTLDSFRICTQKHTALSSRISPLRLTFHSSGCRLIPSCLLCFVTHFQDISFSKFGIIASIIGSGKRIHGSVELSDVAPMKDLGSWAPHPVLSLRVP